jgi:hypothetical protein
LGFEEMKIPRPPEFFAVNAVFVMVSLGAAFLALPFLKRLLDWSTWMGPIYIAAAGALGWLAGYFVKRVGYPRARH